MYQYWAFGLNISSEIEFPQMLPHNFEEADVTITIGKVPDSLEGDNVITRRRISASPYEYLLHINNTARYYAANGNRLIIEPVKGADINSIRLFMLSNAMAAIIHQRGCIPFHASGIITDEGIVLFTGRSGIGKSTTALALMQEGYQLFTDDVCVLSYSKNSCKIEAVSSYPVMKLWENTMGLFAIQNTSYRKYQLKSDAPKFGIFQHNNFTTRQQEVSKIFILKTNTEGNEISHKVLNKLESFNALEQNTYRRKQIDLMGFRKNHFEVISALVHQATVIELMRPQHGEVKLFTNYLLNFLPSK